MTVALLKPDVAHLRDYLDALSRGWSPDNIQPEVTARAEMARAEADGEAFVASLDDPEARGPPITLPDGTQFNRLPSFRRWIWDDGFCGSISLRWLQQGDPRLPPNVLGHVGYAVVPWRRGRGYAAAALRLLLPEARALALPWLEITTRPDNVASQKVVMAVGGRLIETFRKPEAYGGGETQRWRIDL